MQWSGILGEDGGVRYQLVLRRKAKQIKKFGGGFSMLFYYAQSSRYETPIRPQTQQSRLFSALT